MSDERSDKPCQSDSSENCDKDRRKDEGFKEVFIDRRRIERRVIVQKIDFEDRRKGQRRAPTLGLDFKDRRRQSADDQTSSRQQNPSDDQDD